MSYSEKLKDPRWQKVRLKVFERDYWQCMRCDCDNKTLHAHHLKYENGKDPWEYDLKDIVTLCDDCHTKAHDDNEDIARQVHKEIIPLSHDDHEKVHEFNKFYLNFYENDRDIKRSDSHYCRCIRAYFIDSDFNFTSHKNIVKRIVGRYLPLASNADYLVSSYDDIQKYIILSQHSSHKFLYNDLDKLIKTTIDRLSTDAFFLFIIGSEEEKLDAVLYDFILRQTTLNALFQDNGLEVLDYCLLTLIDGSTKDPLFFMWDEWKWIECFDSIDYTPPELRDEPT